MLHYGNLRPIDTIIYHVPLMRMKYILIIYSLTPPRREQKIYRDKFFRGVGNSLKGSPYILGATCLGRFMVGEPWPGKLAPIQPPRPRQACKAARPPTPVNSLVREGDFASRIR